MYLPAGIRSEVFTAFAIRVETSLKTGLVDKVDWASSRSIEAEKLRLTVIEALAITNVRMVFASEECASVTLTESGRCAAPN